MERRFGSSGFAPFLRLVLAAAAVASVLSGCATSGAVVVSSGEGSADVAGLLRQAREFSVRGESHRAEQYFLAALDAGANPDETYPQLIDACIRGGRLGSASVHVDKRVRERPDDLRLLRLSISLEEGLGHSRKASARAEKLAASPRLSAEEELFLVGYFERAGLASRALDYLRSYMGKRSESERPAWVEDALSRLESSRYEAQAGFEASLDEDGRHD